MNMNMNMNLLALTIPQPIISPQHPNESIKSPNTMTLSSPTLAGGDHFLISLHIAREHSRMRQAAHIALKGGSASNALALRTAIQNTAARPTPDSIRALFSHPNLIPQQAAELWEIAVNNRLTNDTQLCFAYLGYQSHRGDAESVKRAMDLMAKNGFLHTEKTYDLLIRAYINMKNTVGVLKSYFQLAQADVEATDTGIQTSVLTYFARNPHYIELVELFLALTSTSPRPQYNVLYHSVINEVLKSGSDIRNSQKIHQLLREMDTLRILPLPATFEVLLHSDVIDFETALQLFTKMRKHRMTTVYAYAGMIQRNGQQGRLKECMRLWSELLAHNINPTPAAYLAIMQPLAQRGRSREVTKMINDMLSRGVRVSLLAYTIQAQAFIVEGTLPRAVAVLDDMAAHRVRPDDKLFGILVRAHMDADDLKTSAQLVERAYSTGVEAGTLVAILVSGFGDPESQEAHEELLKKLDEKKVEVTQQTRDVITRRQATVPFPPGSPPFSYRQPRSSQFPSSETPSTQPTLQSIPLHPPLPTQHLQPAQPSPPHSLPQFSQPQYHMGYPLQYQYPYPHPIYVQYDPTQPIQPHSPYPYQYPPLQHIQSPLQQPSINGPPSPSPILSESPDPSPYPTESTNTMANSTESPDSSSSSTKSPNSDQDTEQTSQSSQLPFSDAASTPSSATSPQSVDAPDKSEFPSFSQANPPQPLSPTYNHSPPSLTRILSDPPSSLPPPLRAPLPDPHRPKYHPPSTSSNTTNSLDPNLNPNDLNIPNSGTPTQTKRAVLQRLKRKSERQEKKIQALQSRNELNSFMLEKLNSSPPPPLPAPHPLPSPPPAEQQTNQQMSPDDYRRELEQMMKAIQQKLDAFKSNTNNNTTIETNNPTNSEKNTTETDNSNQAEDTSNKANKEEIMTKEEHTESQQQREVKENQ